MNEEIKISANNGERCSNERHKFRIGIDDRETTEFSAGSGDFFVQLQNAMIDHGTSHKKGFPGSVYLQVLAGSWTNIQNPSTGGVMAVNSKITEESAITLFKWACNAVQMGRDICSLASGLAQLSTDSEAK